MVISSSEENGAPNPSSTLR